MILFAPAAVTAASVVLTVATTLTSPDVQPLAPPAELSETATIVSAGGARATITARASGVSHDRKVAPGATVKVTGRLPTRLARAKVTLLRAEGSRWKRADAGRASKRGTYVLKTRAATKPGRYGYAVSATSRRRSMTKTFFVRVTAPGQDPDTGVNENTTPTPAPVPVPVPTPTTLPLPPTGGLGDPNDWTHINERAPRWDPCTPITWSVVGATPYAGHVADLTNAFALISTKTGLSFTQVADPAVSTFDVSWSNAAEHPMLGGNVLGFGGPSYHTTPAGAKITSGRVVLDNAHAIPAGFEPTQQASWGKVMVHEMMHAVGLGHAARREQVMYPMIGAPALGAGDISGLYAVGAAKGCFPADDSRTAPPVDTTLQK